MENTKINSLVVFMLAVAMLVVGIATGMVYLDYTYSKVDGLWIYNRNITTAADIMMKYNLRADWVCIDIKGMDYERAVDVCEHEVGHQIFHEMFAGLCEKNFTACEEMIDEKQNA